MSYSNTVPCTAVVRVEARSMIFTVCGVIYGVIMGSHICIVTQRACRADLSVEVHEFQTYSNQTVSTKALFRLL